MAEKQSEKGEGTAEGSAGKGGEKKLELGWNSP